MTTGILLLASWASATTHPGIALQAYSRHIIDVDAAALPQQPQTAAQVTAQAIAICKKAGVEANVRADGLNMRYETSGGGETLYLDLVFEKAADAEQAGDLATRLQQELPVLFVTPEPEIYKNGAWQAWTANIK